MEKKKQILAIVAIAVVAILVVAAMGLLGSGEPESYDGYDLEQSSNAGMLAELKSSYDNEEWIIVTMWSPHWAFAEWDLKYLEDPEGVFGGVEHVETLARLGFQADNPRAYAIVEAFNWTQADIQSVMSDIAGGMGEEAAAQKWIDANQEAVDAWIAAGADIPEDANKALNFGYVLWDGEIAATNVLTLALEQEGYDVDMINVDAGVLYSSIANNDIDFTVSSWLPATHGHYLEQYGDSLVRVSTNLDGCKIGLAVPTYVTDVNSIADLVDYANEFKGRIVGIDPGAGIMSATETAIEVYGLAPS